MIHKLSRKKCLTNRFTAALNCLILSFTSCLYLGDAGISVSGTVVDSAGIPVSGVETSLTPIGRRIPGMPLVYTTDERGAFWLDTTFAPTGAKTTFLLVAKKEGYYDEQQRIEQEMLSNVVMRLTLLPAK